jgi:hypothetical protein
MTDIFLLLVGAVLIAVLDMSAPDYWVTICVLGRALGWNSRRLLGVFNRDGYWSLSCFCQVGVWNCCIIWVFVAFPLDLYQDSQMQTIHEM